MTKRLKIGAVTTLAIAAFALVYALIVLPKRPFAPSPAATEPPPVPVGSLVDLSKIIYDAKTTVPGTGVTFSYPKEGYYGKGVRLVNNSWPSGLNVNDVALSEIESLYLSSLKDDMISAQQINIQVFNLDKGEGLENILNGLGIPGPYYPIPGRLETISGTRFYLQPAKTSAINTYTIYGYSAYAVVNGHLLVVTFDGGFDGDDASNTPTLVKQFLSRLDFTCISDCSVNSASIIESNGSEQ